MYLKIALAILKNYWYYIVIAVLAIAVYFLFKGMSEYKDKSIRFEQNYIASLEKPGEQNDVYLTKNEFEDMYADLIDTIQSSIKNIKPKNISKVYKINNHYLDSTTVIYNAKPSSMPDVFDISYIDTCWGFTGDFRLIDTTVIVKEKWFEDSYKIVDYWKRQNLFNIKLLPRWGSKKYYRKKIGGCNQDTVKIQQIEIGKIKN